MERKAKQKTLEGQKHVCWRKQSNFRNLFQELWVAGIKDLPLLVTIKANHQHKRKNL